MQETSVYEEVFVGNVHVCMYTIEGNFVPNHYFTKP